jgi:hypothetical protein
MTHKTFVVPAALLLTGIGLMIGAYVLLGPGAAPTAPDPAPATLASAGVAPAEIDSARRSDDDAYDDHTTPATPAATRPIQLPEARPALDRALEARRRAASPPAPPSAPPPALDPEAQAANDAYIALRTRVLGDVQRALDGQSDALRDACWQPGLTGGAASASFKINATFDADGKLLAKGISDDRDAGAPGVGQCLRQQPLALEIPPPGKAITVDAPLRLP